MIEQRKGGITDLHVPYMISDIQSYTCLQLIVFERADLVFVFNFHPKNTYEGYVTQFSDLYNIQSFSFHVAQDKEFKVYSTSMFLFLIPDNQSICI